MVTTVLSVAGAAVFAHACWKCFVGILSSGVKPAFTPWWHFAHYTLPAATVGLSAVVLLAAPWVRLRPPWSWLLSVVGIASGIWEMHWFDAVRYVVVPHMNQFDRHHYFGNTVWLWLLEPASLVLVLVTLRDA